jgi:hypothetical protein
VTTLALDLATQLGHALLRADGKIESGTERFAPKAREGDGARWVKFHRWLLDVKQAHPDLAHIEYEEVVGMLPGQVYAMQIFGGFKAILLRFCEHHGLTYHGTNVSTVKKRWTGNGNANKAAMIARCRELGFNPEDDNEADAIALLHVATGRAPAIPVEPKKARPKRNPDRATKSLAIAPDPF